MSRKILPIIGFCLASSFHLHAQARETKDIGALTPDEARLFSVMKERNISDFIVMNEKTATIKYIEAGQVALVSPAISGRAKGDNPEINPSVTPAGIFPLRDVENSNHILFLAHRQSAYLIHPSNGGAKQKLFQNKNPDKLRASNGCIAVPKAVFEIFKDISKDNRNKGNPLLVVLPEEEGIASFLDKHFPPIKTLGSPENN